MTLEEVQSAMHVYGNNIVHITLNDDSIIKCILSDAFPSHPKDPRGYTEPYFYVIRIDKQQNPTEKFNCSEIKSILQP
jgi:hypothetical protein